MERVNEVKGELVVGKKYLVLTCSLNGFAESSFPVFGPIHTDEELGNFEKHIHLDYRFTNDDKDYRQTHGVPFNNWYTHYVPALNINYHSRFSDEDIKIEEKAMMCLRIGQPIHITWNVPAMKPLIQNMKEKGFKLDMNNRFCLHKGANLNSVPIRDNCIQCPNHGMKYDSKTGEIILQE